MTRPYDSQQKKRTCQVGDFDAFADLWVKLKESKKRDKYQELTWELKNYGTWKWQWYEL